MNQPAVKRSNIHSKKLNAKASFSLCPEISDLKTERKIEQFIKLFRNVINISNYYYAFCVYEEYYQKVLEFLMLGCLGSAVGNRKDKVPCY